MLIRAMCRNSIFDTRTIIASVDDRSHNSANAERSKYAEKACYIVYACHCSMVWISRNQGPSPTAIPRRIHRIFSDLQNYVAQDAFDFGLCRLYIYIYFSCAAEVHACTRTYECIWTYEHMDIPIYIQTTARMSAQAFAAHGYIEAITSSVRFCID